MCRIQYQFFLSNLHKYYSVDPNYDVEMEEEIHDSEDDDMDANDVEQKGPGRPPKTFESSGYDSQKRQTNELLDEIRETATELGVDVHYLVNFIGMREANINGDRALSEMYKELNRSDKNGQPKLAPQRALYLKKKIRLSGNNYLELVKEFGPTFLPSRRKMAEYENSLKVKLEPFQGGHKADLKEVLTKTIQRILEVQKYSGDIEKLIVKLSAGFDGSGSHVQRAGRNSTINTKVGFFY